MLTRRTPMKRTSWPRRVAPATPVSPVQPLARPANYASAAARAPARSKSTPLRSEAYRRAVAAMPCIHCGIAGHSQHAHANEGKGMGAKTDDRTGFPLCAARPGAEGCHTAFDQYRLLPGGRDAHVAAGRAWGARTRAEVERAGKWPARLPRWQDTGDP